MEKSVDAVISNPEASFLVEKDTCLGKSREYFGDARKQDDEKDSVAEMKKDGANPGKEPKVPITHILSGNLSNCIMNISYH